MRLVMVRHGQTVENQNDIIQGHSPGILSEIGKKQATKVAARLCHENFDVIYVSDLKRTEDTAREILKFHAEVPIFYEPRIREQDFGAFEGKNFAILRSELARKGIDYIQWKPIKGESVVELYQRVDGFYEELIEKHKGRSVLLVTHGGVIITMLLRIFGWTMDRYREIIPVNGAISIIHIQGNGSYQVEALNLVDHLESGVM